MNDPNPQHSDMVIRLFVEHQRWLHGYIVSLMGNAADADDIVQEVSVIFWKRHQDFQENTNFVSWLSVIAYRQVQKYWRDEKKRRVFQNTELIDQLAETLAEDHLASESRRHALRDCAEGLSPSDQELLTHCYSDKKVTIKSVAKHLGRPENTVYKALGRIRELLHRCIDQKIVSEGVI